MVALQGSINAARRTNELAYLAVNEPRAILRAQQIVLLIRSTEGRLHVRSVSSISTVDRTSPVILWFEALVARLEAAHGLSRDCGLTTTTFSGEALDYGRSYPLRELMWLPWIDTRGVVFGGMLLARTAPFGESDAAIGRHVAASLAHAWRSLAVPAWQNRFRLGMPPRARLLAAMTAVAAALMPVSMTALAPVEIAPRGAAIVTAGVDGVIKAVAVEPNETVVKGQLLIQFVDTTLRNRFEVADREVGVAAMKYKKAAQMAFTDARGRHELAIAQADLALRTAERDYALEMLGRAEIRAERDGVAFYGDKKELIGRPAAIGEKLMEIAAPAEVEFRIDLGVADAVVLREGARVKVFLDSDPLRPVEARLLRASYRARARDGNQLAFRLVAEPDRAPSPTLRIGIRGTAQIYSDLVPFGFYLLRRPIAAARQWLGL